MTWIFLPFTTRQFFPGFTLPGNFPWTESYFSRCARASGSARSLMTFTSNLPFRWHIPRSGTGLGYRAEAQPDPTGNRRPFPAPVGPGSTLVGQVTVRHTSGGIAAKA